MGAMIGLVLLVALISTLISGVGYAINKRRTWGKVFLASAGISVLALAAAVWL